MRNYPGWLHVAQAIWQCTCLLNVDLLLT